MSAPHAQTTRLAKLLMLAGLIIFCVSLIGAFDGYNSQSMLLSLVGVSRYGGTPCNGGGAPSAFPSYSAPLAPRPSHASISGCPLQTNSLAALSRRFYFWPQHSHPRIPIRIQLLQFVDGDAIGHLVCVTRADGRQVQDAVAFVNGFVDEDRAGLPS